MAREWRLDLGKWLGIAFLVIGARSAWAADDPKAVVAAAEDAAIRGDYERARTAAAPLTERGDLEREVKARLYLLEARIADAYEDFIAAKAWLAKLKAVAPEAKLDRYRDPPTLFRAWDELKGASPAPPANLPDSSDAALKRTAPVWTLYAPFGIGLFAADEPKAGAAFLTADLAALYLTLSGSLAGRHPDERNTRRAPGAPAAGPLLLIGAYGHEVVYALGQRGSPYSGEQPWTKRLAIFLPFGVGQARNGDPTRAAYFAGAQAAALIVAGTSKDGAASAVGWTAWAAAYGYSVLDAWLRTPNPQTADAVRARLEPWITAGGYGARLVVGLD